MPPPLRGLFSRQHSKHGKRAQDLGMAPGAEKAQHRRADSVDTPASDPLDALRPEQLELLSNFDSSALADLRYVKFKIQDFRGAKHAVFVPDHLQLSPAVLEQVCDALGREMPTMTLCGMGDVCHPSAFTTAELRRCQHFSSIVREARQHQPNAKPQRSSTLFTKLCGPDEQPAPEPTTPRSQRTEEAFVNSVLEKKLGAVAAGIEAAAHQTNIWTFSGPRLTSFEILLQQMCEQAGKKGVFSVTAVHMQDRAYMENQTSLGLLKRLFGESLPMSHQAAQTADAITLSDDLWNPRVNNSNAEFRMHGDGYWSFTSLDDPRAMGHPLGRWPWPHADLFFFFYREDKTTGQADWNYTTKSRLSQEDVSLQAEDIAPPGYVFFRGGVQLKRQLLQVLQRGRPTVLLQNTPGVSKQMSELVSVLKLALEGSKVDIQPLLADGCHLSSRPSRMELLQGLSPSKLLRHIDGTFDSSSMECGARVTLSDVVGLLDLARQRPSVFREPVCIVDPLKEQQDVASQVAVAFASIAVDLSSTGASRNATRSLVMRGWQLHARLVRSASHLRALAVGMEMLASVSILIATTLAALAILLQLQRTWMRQEAFAEYMESLAPEALQNSGDSHSYIFGFCQSSRAALAVRSGVLVSPVAAGIVLTLQSHSQLFQKWGVANLASQQVVAEIYRFLASAGPYSKEPALNRHRFLNRLNDIVKDVSLGRGEEGHALSDGHDEDHFESDFEALQKHIDTSLYGASSWDALFGEQGSGWRQDGSGYDFATPLTVKAYVDHRLHPLIKYHQSRGRPLMEGRTALYVLATTALVVGAAAAEYDQPLWVPVCISAATAALCLLGWGSSSRSRAMASGLTTFQGLELSFCAYGLQDRHSQITCRRLVSKVERANLLVASAMSRCPLMPEVEEEPVVISPDGGQWDPYGGSALQTGRATPCKRSATPRSVWM